MVAVSLDELQLIWAEVMAPVPEVEAVWVEEQLSENGMRRFHFVASSGLSYRRGSGRVALSLSDELIDSLSVADRTKYIAEMLRQEVRAGCPYSARFVKEVEQVKKYIYFGKDKSGAVVPVFECVAEEDPTPEQVNTIYYEMLRQKGLGAPRPSHVATLDLIEIVQTQAAEDVPLVAHGEVVN